MSIKTTLEVSKTINGKRHPAGSVSYTLLTLDDFGLAAPDSIDKEGMPVYTNTDLAFLQDCVSAACAATIRNIAKVEGDTPDSLVIVPTRDYPSTLTEYAEGATGGRFFEVRKVALELWAAFVASLDIPADGKKSLVALFGNSQAVKALAAKTKERFAGYVTRFVGSLNADQQAGIAGYIRTIETALNAEELAGF